MSDSEKIQLVDAHGQPISAQKKALMIPIAEREQLAAKIYNYYISSADAQQFIDKALMFADVSDPNHITLNLTSPEFTDFCIRYGSQEIINSSLDENLLKAYELVLNFSTSHEYLRQGDVLSLDVDDLPKVSTHFGAAPELQIAIGVCSVQTDLINLLNGTSGKNITSYQANRIQEKFEDLSQYLNSEQKAAGYYNISILHRALLPEKDDYMSSESSAEHECLKKVLEYTGDYKRINYCVNRLENYKADFGLIRAAYRRSLTETTVPSDLYKIHTALAQCYMQDYHPKIGFENNSSAYNPENDKLQKAELHYQQAFKYAQKPERLNILKSIAKLQMRQGNIDDWTATETKLAMKFLTGESRVSLLIEIAGKNAKYAKDYLEKSLDEVSHSRKITTGKKKLLIGKIDHFLRPIYQKDNNRDGLQRLDNIVKQYQQHQAQCPLLQYQTKRKQRD